MKTIVPLSSLLLIVSALALGFGRGAWAAASAADTDLSPTIRHPVRVVDPQGKPLGGATVECYRWPMPQDGIQREGRVERKVTADADGLATLSITNQEPVTLIASKPGWSLGWNTWSPEDDEVPIPSELTLTAPLAISGMVQDAAGKPVADAQVWVSFGLRARKSGALNQPLNVLRPEQAKQRLATRSSAEGRFTIEALPADATVELAVAKPGLAMSQKSDSSFVNGLKYRAGQTNIVLTLEPGATVEGHVIREDTGAPVAGARVFVVEAQPSAPETIQTTDSDGYFRFRDVASGIHTLRALIGTNPFPDLICEPVTVSVEAGATHRDAKFKAVAGGVLEVSVREESTGKPVKDALIGISAESTAQNVRTSDQGIARVRLVPSTYHCYVSKSGLKGYQGQVAVERGQTSRLAATLEPLARFTGRVLDQDGKPAPQIPVALFPHHQAEKKTDQDGRFALQVDTSRFGGMVSVQLIVIARDADRNLVAALPVAEDATNAVLTLGPARTLVGRVAGAGGEPVTNAMVNVILRAERIGASLSAPVTVDGSGRFEFRALPSGYDYDVNAQASGYGTETRRVEAAATNSLRIEVEPIELVVADQRVAGMVVDEDDKPVAGAMVYSHGEKQPSAGGRSDAQGRFVIEHVCAGPINLSASLQRDRRYGSARAEGGDTNITIRLGRQSTMRSTPSIKVSGLVTDPNGKAAAKVAVSLLPAGPEAPRTTDAEGRFTLTSDLRYGRSMQPQPNTVVARDLEHNLAAALDAEEGQTTNVNLRLAPALTMTGRVIDGNGKGITNADAQIMVRSDRMLSPLGGPIRADADGRFEIKALPLARRYQLLVSAKGYGHEQRDLGNVEDSTKQLALDPFELLVADQRIAGVVLDANDKPVSRAYIHVGGNRQPSLSSQTDSKGRFAFEQVCLGSMQLSANEPNSQTFGSASVVAGDTNIVIRLGSMGGRLVAPRPLSLKGKPLPDLGSSGLSADDAPADRPVLAMVVDAEQRPSRRALRVLGERATSLREKGLAVVAIHAGSMAGDAFTAWKQEAKLPFAIGCLKEKPEKNRLAWGAAALPWLVLTDKNHRVIAAGFALEELDAQIQTLNK